MLRERIVPFGGLSFVVVAALMLWTVIVRNPDTHGHLWTSLPSDYDRTPVDTIAEANLQATLAELPPFAFPEPKGLRLAEKPSGSLGAGDRMAGMDMGAGSAPSREEVQQVTLTQSEYGFSPDRLTVKAGAPVELKLVNEGKRPHGVWMPDFGISEETRGGKTEVFQFTPDKPGRYRFTCAYNLCGKEEEHAKMVGFLTVQ